MIIYVSMTTNYWNLCEMWENSIVVILINEKLPNSVKCFNWDKWQSKGFTVYSFCQQLFIKYVSTFNVMLSTSTEDIIVQIPVNNLHQDNLPSCWVLDGFSLVLFVHWKERWKFVKICLVAPLSCSHAVPSYAPPSPGDNCIECCVLSVIERFYTLQLSPCQGLLPGSCLY